MGLDPGCQGPQDISRIIDVDVLVKDKYVLGVIEGKGCRGRTAGVPLRHLMHRDEHIVVGVATHLANSLNPRDRLTAAAEIGPFPRKVHPGLVPLRSNHRLIHPPLAIVDRTNLVVGAGGVALGTQITRCLPKWSFHHTFTRGEYPLNHNLCIRGNQKVLAKSLRGSQTKGFLEIAPYHIEFTDLKRPRVAGPHVIGGVMTEHGRHGTLEIILLIIQEDLP